MPRGVAARYLVSLLHLQPGWWHDGAKRGSGGGSPAGRGCDEGKGVIGVEIQLSVVLLLAIVLVVMIKGGSIKTGPAIVATLFGFFLAASGAAPPINDFLQSLASTIDNIG